VPVMGRMRSSRSTPLPSRSCSRADGVGRMHEAYGCDFALQGGLGEPVVPGPIFRSARSWRKTVTGCCVRCGGLSAKHAIWDITSVLAGRLLARRHRFRPPRGGNSARLRRVAFRFADTLGMLDPFTTFERIDLLKKTTDIQIEIHAHDDLAWPPQIRWPPCAPGRRM